MAVASAQDVDLSTLPAEKGFRILGTTEEYYVGNSVSNAGDVNGDGIDDLLVGARGSGAQNGWNTQIAHVIYGRNYMAPNVTPFGDLLLPWAAPMHAALGFRVFGSATGEFSDCTMSAAGDVNGDGVGDLIFGAPTASSGGIAHVLFGRNQTFLSTNPFGDVNLTTIATSASIGFRILGATGQAGSAVRAAGDVNGDGIDDVILSAHYASYPYPFAGITYVIFGRNISNGPPFEDIQLTGGSTPLSSTIGFRILGAATGDKSGLSLSAAGDVNGDYIGDIIIGTPQPANGFSYVIFGRNMTGTGDVVLTTTVMPANVGFRILGAAFGDFNGRSVSTAGDVNADGIDDVIVGSCYADPSVGSTAGISYVIFGRNLSAPDATPFGDIQLTADDAPLLPSVGFRILGAAFNDRSGFSVSAAGDVDGDGIDDVIIGSFLADLFNKNNAGISYLISGRNVADGDDPFGDIQLPTTALPASVGFRILGATSDDQCSYSVSAAGDINGDGLADVIIGAPYADTFGGINAGTSYVVFGAYPAPTSQPSSQPSGKPSSQPSTSPSGQPSSQPVGRPTSQPSNQPSDSPSGQPSGMPTSQPSMQPTRRPTTQPSSRPTVQPTVQPSSQPTVQPFGKPSALPTSQPSRQPTTQPSCQPSVRPTRQPSSLPTGQPSKQPTSTPSTQPSGQPSQQPTLQPFGPPSGQPSGQPTGQPSLQPTCQPSAMPSTQPSNQPSRQPSNQPSSQPSSQPIGRPTTQPSVQPSSSPSSQPSRQPTSHPTCQPSIQPTSQPSLQPTALPSSQPSAKPSGQPSSQPTIQPTKQPSTQPSCQPTVRSSAQPTSQPSGKPSMQPSTQPTFQPSGQPLGFPSGQPSSKPTVQPSMTPSSQPSVSPSNRPTSQPTSEPSMQPLGEPSGQPSAQPSDQPSSQPSIQPSVQPSAQPSQKPSSQPSIQPSGQPSAQPSQQPSSQPTAQPSQQPSSQPSMQPSVQPSSQPSAQPFVQPSAQPSQLPSSQPSTEPSVQPSAQPSPQPSCQPSMQPSVQPISQPSAQPSVQPSAQPSQKPSSQPSIQPSVRPSAQPSQQPSSHPTAQPSQQPSSQPSMQPSVQPINQPSAQPSVQPSAQPSQLPSSQPSTEPSVQPSVQPSAQPTSQPSVQTTTEPSVQPSGQPSSQPTAAPSLRPSASPSCFPTSQPTCQPSFQPSIQPTAQPTGQPSVPPTSSPSKDSAEEWVSSIDRKGVARRVASISNSVWACGVNDINNGGSFCVSLDPASGVKINHFPLHWADVTSILHIDDNVAKVVISGRYTTSDSVTSDIAKCAIGDAQLVCTVKSFGDTSFAAGSFLSTVNRLVYVGTTTNNYCSISVLSGPANTVQSYVYSSVALSSVTLLHVHSPPNFIGSFVAGTCVSITSFNYIFAGMVRSDSGVLTGMYIAPVSNSILNSAELVNAMALEDLGPDSFIGGALNWSERPGTFAYLVRINSLYRKVLYGTRYVTREEVETNRRMLISDDMSGSSVQGMVLVENALYLVINKNESGFLGVAVLKTDMTTGGILQQVHIYSYTARIQCADITATSLSVVLVCAVKYPGNATQSMVLSTNFDLTFAKLPLGFSRHTNDTLVAEPVAFHNTILTMTVRSDSRSTTDSAFNTADGSPTRSPSVHPTALPSSQPSGAPSGQPSSNPTSVPSVSPQPTSHPSSSGPTNTYKPTVKPTQRPTALPSMVSTVIPSRMPSRLPTVHPSPLPTTHPSVIPSVTPTSIRPTASPTAKPTRNPTMRSTSTPTGSPSVTSTVASTVQKGRRMYRARESTILGQVVAGLFVLWCLYFLFKWCQQKMEEVKKDKKRIRAMLAQDLAVKPRYPIFTAVAELFYDFDAGLGPGGDEHTDNANMAVSPGVVVTSGPTNRRFGGQGANVDGLRSIAEMEADRSPNDSEISEASEGSDDHSRRSNNSSNNSSSNRSSVSSSGKNIFDDEQNSNSNRSKRRRKKAKNEWEHCNKANAIAKTSTFTVETAPSALVHNVTEDNVKEKTSPTNGRGVPIGAIQESASESDGQPDEENFFEQIARPIYSIPPVNVPSSDGSLASSDVVYTISSDSRDSRDGSIDSSIEVSTESDSDGDTGSATS